jgi:hypothetical protein
MTVPRQAFVHEAELRLEPDADAAAPGGAVTVALCGHWEHEGPCRWPHNNDVSSADGVARFRTLFVAPPAEEPEVRSRIDAALGTGDWSVLRTGARPVDPSEEALARRLATTLEP